MRAATFILIFIVASVSASRISARFDNGADYISDRQIVADRYHKKISGLRAQQYVDSTYYWLQDNGYATNLMFIADMSLSMNIKRFYAVNPDEKKLLKSFIVAHGSGGNSTIDRVTFSNMPGSHCSSAGRYRLGETYNGNYGRSYRLYGLDASNSNAFDRAIVFHSFKDQSDEEYSSPMYLSNGCPMVAQSSFDWCDSMIQLQDKPVLLVIYK